MRFFSAFPFVAFSALSVLLCVNDPGAAPTASVTPQSSEGGFVSNTPRPSAGSYRAHTPLAPAVHGGPQAVAPGTEIPQAAPVPSTLIEAINFDRNAQLTGMYNVPPDPIGAAGPNHVVAVVNTSIFWATKANTGRTEQSLRSFFISLDPSVGIFDPKVIYDQYANRFVVVALEEADNGSVNDPTNTSRILLAVSSTNDPNGTWYYDAIEAKTVIDGNQHWADYPCFSVDKDVIYVDVSMFQFVSNSYGGARLWIIQKNAFYVGGNSGSRRI